MSVDVTDIFFTPIEKPSPLLALKEAIKQNEEKITELNKEQLDKGLDADGRSLGKYKNFKYKGRYEPVDLKLTGDFRNAFEIIVSDTDTEIKSSDYKESSLTKRYGQDIFGVAPDLIDDMESIILEDFINDFNKQLS